MTPKEKLITITPDTIIEEAVQLNALLRLENDEVYQGVLFVLRKDLSAIYCDNATIFRPKPELLKGVAISVKHPMRR
jgi:hypothetical protein